MRKNLNRVLACLLSVALLVTCAISGLVLPVSADAPVNLLEGKLDESYSFPVGTDTKEVKIDGGVTLEASTAYIFRFVASGAKGTFTLVHNGGWFHTETAESETERIYQYTFTTATTNLDQISIYAWNYGETDTYNVRNVELIKAPADGEFNVLPGGDFNIESQAFKDFYDKGATIVKDPDNADNNVLCVPANTAALENSSALTTYGAKHMLLEISFRYKGYLRMDDWMGANGCFAGNEGATATSGSGGTYNGKTAPQYLTYRSDNEWKTGSVIVYRGDGSQDIYYTWRNMSASAPLYLDDITVVKVASPVELNLNKSAIEIYPGNFTELTYTTVPTLAYVPAGGIVWTSSNPSVISVDQNGKVTAAPDAEFGATATITAKYSDTVKDTCEVTVSDGAPKPPAYTEAGKNPFALVDTNVNMVGGADPVVLSANALLKANTRYMVKFNAKSSVAGATVTTNATGTYVVEIPQSEGWMANGFSFKTTDGGMSFALTFNASSDSTATLNVKDVELWEMTDDGTFNVVPGSSFSTGTEALDSIFFINHLNGGLAEVVDDPDEVGNKMLKVTGSGYYGFKEVLGYSGFPAKALKFTFRYKGGAVQMDNWGKNVHYIDFPEGTSILARKENDTQIRCIQLANTATWKTVTVIAAVQDYSQATYLQLQPTYNSSFYIDDFQMVEMPLSTELILDKTALNLYPEDSDILNVTGGPAGSFLDMNKVTWKSSDETVATVDAYGNVKAVGTTDGATAVITAMLDGVDKATCLLTIDYDAPKPPQPTEPGVNAMENVADTSVGQGQTTSVKAGAILKANTRYALRFVSKSSGNVTITTNGGSAAKDVRATANWRASQILFTTGAEQVDNFMITIAVADSEGANIEIKEWELYEAPTDGTFNLIPGSTADYESDYLDDHHARGVTVVDDGTGNNVFYFSTNLTEELPSYLDIGAIGGMTPGKVWKITFRLKGGMVRFEDWGSGSDRPEQPDAYMVSGNKQYVYFKTEDWTTVSYYIKMEDSQAPYLTFRNSNNFGSQQEAWIDDIQLYELDPAESMSILEQDLHLYPTSTQQLTHKFSPEGSVPLGDKVQWSSSDEGVALVDKDTGFVTLVGDDGDTVTITADNGKYQATTTITIDATADHPDPATSLAIKAACGGDLDVGQTAQLVVIGTPAENLVGRLTWTSSDDTIASVTSKGVVTALSEGEVTITATSEFGTSASIKLSTWEHANLIINGDMEQGGGVSWRDKTNVLPEVGMYGSYGWYMDDANTGCYYNQNLVLKPATTYQLSFRYKAEKGVSARIYAAAIGGGNLYASVYCEPGTLEDAEWQFASKTFTTVDFWDAEATWALSVDLDAEATVDGSRMIYDNVCLREFVTGEPVTTVEINQQDVSLAPGRNVKLTVTTEPLVGDVNDLVWWSSDEQVAYVVAGNVFGVGAGTATIYVKTKSGAIGECEVTVNGAPALLNNGTFETQDNPETEELEGSWVLSDKDAAYFEGGGINASYGMQMYKGGTISQTFKGLKADTVYQVMLRSRQRSAATIYDIVITDKNGREVAKMQGGGDAQRSVVYKSAFAKYDFITPADLVPDEEYTFTLSYRPEAGEVLYLDQLMIAEAASDVDLIVSDITWTPDNADQVEPGTKVSFIVSIVNQGLEAYGGAKGIDVDIMVDAKKVLTISRPASAIAIGTMIAVEAPEGQEWIATEGDHTITAHVNSTMTVLENDPDNNYASANLRVAKKEDFAVAPAGAIEKGYNRLVFSDDFSSLDTFDTLASGNHGYKWYVTRPWGEPNVSAGRDFSILEDSYLKVHTVQTAWNYSICTIDAKKPGVGYSFNMGYVEFRVRMKETAEGGTVNDIRVPAIWAFSDETIWETRPKGKGSLELDWIEYWGNKYGELRFDTTLHDSRYDENGNHVSKVSSGEKHYEPIGDYNWHVYGMAWSKGNLKTYFDGELIATLKYSEDGWPDPMPGGVINVGGDDDPYEGLWSILDNQNMPIILGGASDFPLEVDWVRVWQSDGSIDPVPEQDEAVTDFIKDYGTYGGSLITEPTAKNYQTIMNGEAAYNALTAEQQAEVDNELGISYLDLVTQVYDGISVAENFIAYYACAEDGTPYMAVDNTNYEWIASAQSEWDMMSDFARELVNMAVSANSGMSFQELLDAALAYVPTFTDEPPVDEPQQPVQQKANLTWLWIALGVVGVLLVAGGVVIALLLFSKKRKAAK